VCDCVYGVYLSWIHDVDQLKSRLFKEWEQLHQMSIDEVIRHGVHVFECAFEHTEDILNTEFGYV